MVTKVKKLRDFDIDNKDLIVGLPGMGRVGYVSANHFIKAFKGSLVAEVYSSYFPPQLIVGKDGVSKLFIGQLYDIGKALVFTAETQPPSSEGQNEVCDKLLEFLIGNGKLRSVIAAAAFVVPQVGSVRKVFVAGNSEDIINNLVKLGAEPLNEGVITGINGAIVGWASYYGVPAAVVLGETWAPIVELDEIDYRAAKRVVEVISKYLGVKVDTHYMDVAANSIEGRVVAILKRAAPEKGKEERREVL